MSVNVNNVVTVTLLQSGALAMADIGTLRIDTAELQIRSERGIEIET